MESIQLTAFDRELRPEPHFILCLDAKNETRKVNLPAACLPVGRVGRDKTNPRLVPARSLRFVGPPHGAY